MPSKTIGTRLSKGSLGARKTTIINSQKRKISTKKAGFRANENFLPMTTRWKKMMKVLILFTEEDFKPLKLLPIFNRNADAHLQEMTLFPVVPKKKPSIVIPAIRSRERTSIDLLRNLFDEIMTPGTNTADPRIAKFRSSYYVKREEEEDELMV